MFARARPLRVRPQAPHVELDYPEDWDVGEVDAVFIRPRQREALARTLVRFARELAAERAALSET